MIIPSGLSFRRGRALLLVFLTCLPGATAAAQDVPVLLPFRKYTSADGLIHNRCHVVRQDSSGYIWIGTDVGMVRYDGRAFRLFNIPGERFVSSRTAIVSGGDVCFGIDNRGIAICRGDSIRFLSFEQGRFGGVNGLLRTGRSAFLFTDGSRNIWTIADGRITAHRVAMNDSTNRGFLELCRDWRGNIWAGSDNGICVFRKGDLSRPRWLSFLGGSYVNCVRNAPDSALLILSTTGLYRIPAEALRAEDPGNAARLLFFPPTPYGSDAALSGLAFLGNTLWISSGYRGIYQMRPDGTNVRFFSAANGMHSETVWDVFADREANLWFATENGVSKLSRQNLRNFDLSRTTFTQIKSGRPLSDSMFLFTNGVHLYVAGRDNKVVRLEGVEENPGFLEERFVPTPDGRLYFTCHSATTHGDFRYMTRLLHLQPGRAVPGEVVRGAAGDTLALQAGTLGRIGQELYVCSRSNSLLLYRDGRFRKCVVQDGGRPRSANRFAAIGGSRIAVLTGEGRILLARQVAPDSFTVLQQLPDFLERSHGVTDMYTDRRGWLWIGTYNDGAWVGLPRGGTMAFYSVPAGTFSSQRVTCFAEDSSGVLWIGTMNGLDRLSRENGRPMVLKDRYGSELCGRYIYFVRPWGKSICVGTADCMSVIDPGEDTPPDRAPQVYLSGISLNGRPWSTRATTDRTIFRPDDNNLSFSFTGLHFRDESRTRYSYRLIGFDDSWAPPTSAFTVTYPRIPPGRYTFEVRAGTERGIWSAPARFVFEIEKPLYSRWPFLLAVALLLAGAVYSLYRYRITQILRLEKLRQKLSKDLHDDIGATVSSIGILAEMAGNEAVAPERRSNFLDTISEQSRYVTGALSDIVWAINPEADTPGAMFARMRRYASEIFEARDIQYSIQLPGDDAASIRAGMETRQHILLIFKEAVNNLAKYSGAAHAHILLELDGSFLEMTVRDDGQGFDPQTVRGGNGLANMQKRAAALRGTLQIDSTPGNGTAIRLRIPFRR